jgi:TPR repeat protein
VQIASAQHPTPIPIFAAEAIYLRATFSASGAYPDHVPHNPRIAFRDFEQAARAGYAQAWFRLGRDYENFNDALHARDCFERGLKLNVESCVYVGVFFSLLP